MSIPDDLRSAARILDRLADALERDEDGKAGRSRHPAAAEAVVRPGVRRRLTADPQRFFKSDDDGVDRIALRLRELDDILGRLEAEADLGVRES